MPDFFPLLPTTLDGWAVYVAGKIGYDPRNVDDPGAWLVLHRDEARRCMSAEDYDGLLHALFAHRVPYGRIDHPRTPWLPAYIQGVADAIYERRSMPPLFSAYDERIVPDEPFPFSMSPQIDRVQTPFRVRHPKVAQFDSAQFDHDRAPLMLELEAKMMDTVREAQAGLAARLAEHPLPPGWDWQFDIASWDINEPARLVMTATPCIITREAFDQAVRIWGVQEAYGHAARGFIGIEDD